MCVISLYINLMVCITRAGCRRELLDCIHRHRVRQQELKGEVKKREGIIHIFQSRVKMLKKRRAFACHIFSACSLPNVGLKEVESICRAALREFFKCAECEDEDEQDTMMHDDISANEAAHINGTFVEVEQQSTDDDARVAADGNATTSSSPRAAQADGISNLLSDDDDEDAAFDVV